METLSPGETFEQRIETLEGKIKKLENQRKELLGLFYIVLKDAKEVRIPISALSEVDHGTAILEMVRDPVKQEWIIYTGTCENEQLEKPLENENP